GGPFSEAGPGFWNSPGGDPFVFDIFFEWGMRDGLVRLVQRRIFTRLWPFGEFFGDLHVGRNMLALFYWANHQVHDGSRWPVQAKSARLGQILVLVSKLAIDV